MDKITLHLKADEQILTSAECPFKLASNTVSYVEAVFELGENWTGYDSVRAVWTTYLDTIATVLDGEGKCVVPHEVLTRTGKVSVNLVGSIVEDEELTDRLTTYPTVALNVNADAYVEGTETAPITPSQFEQYVADVAEEVAKIKDIESTTLNDDYTLTFVFSDGTSTTVGPIRGEQGPQGETGPQGPEGPPGEVTMAQFESAFPTDTASGAIASFPDGSDLFSAKSLVAEINPIQDLNGYDSPWVGGASANKFDSVSWGALGSNPNFYTVNSSNGYITITASDGSGISNRLFNMPAGEQFKVVQSGFNDVKLFNSSSASLNTSNFTVPNDGKIALKVTASSYPTTGWVMIVPYSSTQSTYVPYANICPISGWDSVGVVDCGKNLFDVDSLTSVPIDTSATMRNGFEIGKVGTFTVSASTHTANSYLYAKKKNADGTYSSQDYIATNTSQYSKTYTLQSGEKIVIYDASGANNMATSKAIFEACNIQIEVGSSKTDYAEYTSRTYIATLPTTTYGGSVDMVSGVGDTLKTNQDLSALTWTLRDTGTHHKGWSAQLPNNYITSTDSNPVLDFLVSDYTYRGGTTGYTIEVVGADNYNIGLYHFTTTNGTPTNNIYCITDINSTPSGQLVYPLATASSFSVTGQSVSILQGQNNIFADSGNVSVTYKADTQLWVEKKLSE